jgi:succinyl-diaminopimelate desuccinylase
MSTAHANLYNHLAHLIAIPSVSGEEIPADEIIMYTATVLEKAGMHVTTFKNDSFPSLVATSIEDSKHPKLLLAAHLDVVPADFDQFTLRQEAGRLYGRGTLDMKFAAACFLEAASQLQEHMGELDFGIMLTTDEEVGGEHGVNYLLQQGYRTDVCLLPDGANNWRVEAQAKGAWAIHAAARGKTGHGSQPWQGENAIEKILGFIAELRRVIPPAKEHTDTTMVVSMIEGGHALNQIPDFASVTLDLRFLGSSTRQELERIVQAAAIPHGVELATKMEAIPVELDLSLPALQVWEDIVEEVRGESNGNYALSFGASDARYFTVYDIPTIVTYPEGEGLHSKEEWIGEKAFYQFYECVVAYVKAIAG